VLGLRSASVSETGKSLGKSFAWLRGRAGRKVGAAPGG
jgi:hypothetical protein